MRVAYLRWKFGVGLRLEYREVGMMEIWKDIIGYEEVYKISNLGQIRSKDRYARVCGVEKGLSKGGFLSLVFVLMVIWKRI